jgi:hypothetical protein
MVGGRVKFGIFFVGVIDRVMRRANIGIYNIGNGWICVFVYFVDLCMATQGKYWAPGWGNRIETGVALEKVN